MVEAGVDVVQEMMRQDGREMWARNSFGSRVGESPERVAAN
jgi:hypothetical protein